MEASSISVATISQQRVRTIYTAKVVALERASAMMVRPIKIVSHLREPATTTTTTRQRPDKWPARQTYRFKCVHSITDTMPSTRCCRPPSCVRPPACVVNRCLLTATIPSAQNREAEDQSQELCLILRLFKNASWRVCVCDDVFTTV